MMSRKRLALAFFSVVIGMLVFPMAASAWPREIEKTLWVPEGAYEIDRRAQNGVYSVSYKLNLCQPAESFISGMKRHMKALSRWKRLEFDPYNPGLKLNHAREPGGRWDIHHHGPDGNDVMQWIDDWEDSGKNVVRYCLRYRAVNNNFRNACVLEVIVSYLPNQTMRGGAPARPNGEDGRGDVGDILHVFTFSIQSPGVDAGNHDGKRRARCLEPPGTGDQCLRINGMWKREEPQSWA